MKLSRRYSKKKASDSEVSQMKCSLHSNNRSLSLRLLSLLCLSIPESLHLYVTQIFAHSDSLISVFFANVNRMNEFDTWIKEQRCHVSQYVKDDQRVIFRYMGESSPPEVTFPNGDKYYLLTLWEGE